MKTYFYDTYALVELLKGSKSYLAITQDTAMIIVKLNLLELHHRITQIKSEHEADAIYDGFAAMTTDIDDDEFKEASKFKRKNKRLKLSYVDCIGYIMAKRRGVKFLTGDKAFKGMENVEFVT